METKIVMIISLGKFYTLVIPSWPFDRPATLHVSLLIFLCVSLGFAFLPPTHTISNEWWSRSLDIVIGEHIFFVVVSLYMDVVHVVVLPSSVHTRRPQSPISTLFFSQSINKPFVYVECLKLMAENRRVLEIRNFFVLEIVNTHVSEAFELAIVIVSVVVVHTATMRSIKLYEKLWALGTRDKSRTSERGERRKNWKFSGEEVILWKNKMFYVNYFKNFYIRIAGAFCVVVDRTKIYREWKSLIFMTFSESNWIELNAELRKQFSISYLPSIYFCWILDGFSILKRTEGSYVIKTENKLRN